MVILLRNKLILTNGSSVKLYGWFVQYYFSPSGDKLRSRKEVLHYLETGSKPKKKLKPEDEASVS